MYEYLRGRLVEKNPAYAVIDCNGVAYYLNISLYSFSKLNDKEDCTLFTHLVVREDAHMLFGFIDTGERELFRHLITVSGVGVSTARIILSSLNPSEVIQAIVDGNAPMLQRIKGIGSKTAERIIIDLRSKLSKSPISAEKTGISYNTNKEEALSALSILGFPKVLAEKVLNKIIESEGSGLSVEQLIKQALRLL
jgi:Holliday junction DNA helicase RuvA